jgi:ABC-type multidrug transport system fused ATPase/permease subunit
MLCRRRAWRRRAKSAQRRAIRPRSGVGQMTLCFIFPTPNVVLSWRLIEMVLLRTMTSGGERTNERNGVDRTDFARRAHTRKRPTAGDGERRRRRRRRALRALAALRRAAPRIVAADDERAADDRRRLGAYRRRGGGDVARLDALLGDHRHVARQRAREQHRPTNKFQLDTTAVAFLNTTFTITIVVFVVFVVIVVVVVAIVDTVAVVVVGVFVVGCTRANVMRLSVFRAGRFLVVVEYLGESDFTQHDNLLLDAQRSNIAVHEQRTEACQEEHDEQNEQNQPVDDVLARWWTADCIQSQFGRTTARGAVFRRLDAVATLESLNVAPMAGSIQQHVAFVERSIRWRSHRSNAVAAGEFVRALLRGNNRDKGQRHQQQRKHHLDTFDPTVKRDVVSVAVYRRDNGAMAYERWYVLDFLLLLLLLFFFLYVFDFVWFSSKFSHRCLVKFF